jgi:hypothetical protein
LRSNPPLAVIAAERPEIDLDWFKNLKKEKVDIGFESYSPNFYYQNSKITAVFTADIARLREMMPEKVRSEVQPLQVWPGRGVVGYNLPKWLTEIDFKDTESTLSFTVTDSETGKVYFVFEGKKLGDVSHKPEVVKSSFTNLDRAGKLTYGYALLRQTSYASSTSADAVALKLGDGSFSTYIKSLKLGKMMKYEYVPEFQSALYAPTGSRPE